MPSNDHAKAEGPATPIPSPTPQPGREGAKVVSLPVRRAPDHPSDDPEPPVAA